MIVRDYKPLHCSFGHGIDPGRALVMAMPASLQRLFFTDSFQDAVAANALCFILRSGLVPAGADRAVHVVRPAAMVHGSRPVDARLLPCVTDATGMSAAEHTLRLLVLVQPRRFFCLSSIAQPTSLSGTVLLQNFSACPISSRASQLTDVMYFTSYAIRPPCFAISSPLVALTAIFGERYRRVFAFAWRITS